MWTITSISSLGDWIGLVAMTVYAQDLSGRPEFAVGGVLLFKVVPGLFFGPFAGVLADRFDRRRLMVTADVMRAGLIASIPWVHHLWQLYLVSALLEILGQLWTPAKDATVPNLVEPEQLMAANQLSLVSTYATFPLSGALVTALAVPAAYLSRLDAFAVLREDPIFLAFFLDALTFLFSASRVATFPAELMRAKRAHVMGSWNPLRELAEGFRFVRRNPMVRTLVVGAWTAFLGGSAIVSLGPIFSKSLVDSAAAEQAAWGALIVAVGLGLVGGMIGASWLTRLASREHIFPWALSLSGIAAMGVGTMASIKPALALTVAVGVGAGVAWVTIFTLLQERTEDRLRGRTFATLQTGIKLSLFAGLAGWPLFAGAIGNHTLSTDRYVVDLSGARVVLVIGGVSLAIAGVAAARNVARANGRNLGRRSVRARGLRLSQPAMSGGARRGLFVAFEGVEGAGKSTQIKLLFDWLTEQGHDVLVTREPGGTPIAERVRHVLLDPASRGMDPKTEALLYAASRSQLVADAIRPALERDGVVLCDRYIDSSLAYQGVARGLGEDDVLRLNLWATDEMLPDIVILLHLDPAAGLARQRGNPDRIEQEDLSFHQAVADAYLHLAREYPSRFSVVDASGAIEQIQQQIRTAILPFLQRDAAIR